MWMDVGCGNNKIVSHETTDSLNLYYISYFTGRPGVINLLSSPQVLSSRNTGSSVYYRVTAQPNTASLVIKDTDSTSL
jgi:hypothetical protein